MLEAGMSVKVREKRGRLYLDVYQSGKRTWEALNLSLTPDKARNKEIRRLAEICRSKRETQLLTGAWNINNPVSGKMPLVAFLEDYSKNYKKPSIVMTCVNHIKEFHGGGIILAHITSKWVEDFQNYMLKKEGISQSTAGYYSRILRSALSKAVKNNMIMKNPSDGIKHISIPETELIYLNSEELKRLAAAAVGDPYGLEVRRAFLFACHTGLRIVDLESITWRRIETNPMQIIKIQVKTKPPVYIPLSKSVRKLIIDGREHQPDELVFNLGTHNRRTSYTYLQKWGREAKITKPMGWHTARRTFATLALENGADIYTVSKLLGHTSIRHVVKYVKATDKLRREAVEALPEIEV
jgi:integrase